MKYEFVKRKWFHMLVGAILLPTLGFALAGIIILLIKVFGDLGYLIMVTCLIGAGLGALYKDMVKQK